MPDVLQTLIPFVVGGMLVLALGLFFVALWYFRRGRRDRYWRQRRSASVHGWQLFLISVTLMFVAAGVCLFSGLASAILEGRNSEATSTSASILLPSPTASTTPIYITATPDGLESSPEPTADVTATEPEPPTATSEDNPVSTPAIRVSPTRPAATVTPTLRSSATPVATSHNSAPGITPLASDVIPPSGLSLNIIAVDSEIGENMLPVDSRSLFAAGLNRVYFWVEYTGMVDGLAWERILIRDTEVVQGGAYLWSGGVEGSDVYFFGVSDGFEAGEYQIRVSIAGDLIASFDIVIE